MLKNDISNNTDNEIAKIFSLETAFAGNNDTLTTNDLCETIGLLIKNKDTLKEFDYYMFINKVICNMYDSLLTLNDNKYKYIVEACKDYVNYNEALMQNKSYVSDFKVKLFAYLNNNEKSDLANFNLWNFILTQYADLSVKEKLSYILNFDRIMNKSKDILDYSINYNPKTDWITDVMVTFNVKDFSKIA